MNLLCPNCQKPLTVPEQYAGQPMRCPLCSGTFTVPALPTSAAPVAPPPPPAAPIAPADTYGFKDPVAPPPVSIQASHAAELAFEQTPSTARAPSGVGGGAPAAPRQAFTEAQPTFPSTPTPEGYQKKYTIWFSPKYLQYVAPVALFLVFILTFFSWVGVYPGGVADATQNMWQAAFGGFSIEPDVKFVVDPFPKYADKNGERSSEPNWDVLLIFYFVVLIPTLVIALACVALPYLPSQKLPPGAHPILPWRWGIVAALDLVLLLFLVLQMVLGFSLVNNGLTAKNSEIAARAEKETDVAPATQARREAIDRGLKRQELRTTVWLDLVVIFHLLALAGAGLMFWLNRRGARPAPRLDTLW